MGKITGIDWTDHTFNIVWGCVQISPACTNCYAMMLAKRWGFDVWGKDAPRRTFGAKKHWNEPLKWNAAAECEGRRHRVFCSSMADVFEDHPTVDQEREKLWPLIRSTPWLDWQLLTKRADRIAQCLPHDWGKGYPNVWLGVTAENQVWADARIPHLLQTPATVRFISAEPLLGPLDVTLHLNRWKCAECGATDHVHPCDSQRFEFCANTIERVTGLDQVIVGGESGPHARPMHPDWARSLRDQCVAAGVSYFFKQWGEWRKVDGEVMIRMSKKYAGRLLDGREWNEFPEL
jgi:protein gp37